MSEYGHTPIQRPSVTFSAYSIWPMTALNNRQFDKLGNYAIIAPDLRV